MNPLDQARAAQADRDARHPDASWHALPGQLRDLGNPWEHLRAALAEVDRLTVERDVYATRLETAEDILDDCVRATNPEATPECLPSTIGGIARERDRLAADLTEAQKSARWRPLTEAPPEGVEVEVCVVAISFTHGEYTIPTLGTFFDGEWEHAAPRGEVYAWRPRQPIPTAPRAIPPVSR